MANLPDPRADLRRALVLNALTKPLNLLVPALVVVAGSLLGAGWLAAVALACWLALAAASFFDEDEARRVGARRRAARTAPATPRAEPAVLSPAIGRRLQAAVAARRAIGEAVALSGLPLADIAEQVDALVAVIEAHAIRADRIHGFLADHPAAGLEHRVASEHEPAVIAALRAQSRSLERLRQRQGQLLAEMDHAVAALDTVHAEILAVDGLDEGTVVGRVAALREEVQVVSAALEDAFDETRARLSAGPADTA